jgi:hypothetical protein
LFWSSGVRLAWSFPKWLLSGRYLHRDR